MELQKDVATCINYSIKHIIAIDGCNLLCKTAEWVHYCYVKVNKQYYSTKLFRSKNTNLARFDEFCKHKTDQVVELQNAING